MKRSPKTRAALCAALLLFVLSGKHASAAGQGIYIELHGLRVSWNGEALGGGSLLQAKCKVLHKQTAGAQFTIASGIDTSPSQVGRIVKIIHQDCGGADYINFEILIRLKPSGQYE